MNPDVLETGVIKIYNPRNAGECTGYVSTEVVQAHGTGKILVDTSKKATKFLKNREEFQGSWMNNDRIAKKLDDQGCA